MEKLKPCVIAIKLEVKKGLDELKILPRETYSQVIERLITMAQVGKELTFQGDIAKQMISETMSEKEEPVPEKKSDNFSDEITICTHCGCMTLTTDSGFCGKCANPKPKDEAGS